MLGEKKGSTWPALPLPSDSPARKPEGPCICLRTCLALLPAWTEVSLCQPRPSPPSSLWLPEQRPALSRLSWRHSRQQIPVPVLLGQDHCQHSVVKDGWKGAAALRSPGQKLLPTWWAWVPGGMGHRGSTSSSSPDPRVGSREDRSPYLGIGYQKKIVGGHMALPKSPCSN